ncbi:MULTISPECIES: hypothetical protein [unclassified Amycolatopsis]|uniref:hypothetical protein n=1 Tax=unclassified Amycolatopsis TaxID=2618356 RepID=UPI002E200284|nr:MULTISPECIES: hypothetical protein [unclassified Amycolatopsis]
MEGFPAEVTAAVREGPFDVAFDLAIRHRGLSLEALQRRMATRGAQVSLATLSYWRRGRRHPEGQRSLHAVGVAEGCLGLPADALTILAARPRVRRTEPWPGGVSLASALGAEPTELGSCDGIDLDGNARLAIASVHQRATLTADRTEASVRTEMVVTSRDDGVDRWVSFFRPQTGGAHHPVLRSARCCRPGRIRRDPSSELLAVELRFDYPLRAGETYVFDFDFGYDGPPPETSYLQFGIRAPARQLVLQACFDPAAVPVRCYRYHRPRDGSPDTAREPELPVGPSLTGHIAVLDAQPGVYGMVWEWD